jgi:hypothetical protein
MPTELEQAFEHYQATVRRAVAAGDWTLFGGLFTDDATYSEHAYGEFRGRAAIAEWAVRTMTTFPGNAMVAFPIEWAILDEERGWVVCDIRNLMRDPGDGSVHETSNLTVLHYGGDGLFAREEDVYNPARFLAMVQGWAAVADEHDTLEEDGQAWLRRYGARAS